MSYLEIVFNVIKVAVSVKGVDQSVGQAIKLAFSKSVMAHF
jgi:hypothetical protein